MHSSYYLLGCWLGDQLVKVLHIFCQLYMHTRRRQKNLCDRAMFCSFQNLKGAFMRLLCLCTETESMVRNKSLYEFTAWSDRGVWAAALLQGSY